MKHETIAILSAANNGIHATITRITTNILIIRLLINILRYSYEILLLHKKFFFFIIYIIIIYY